MCLEPYHCTVGQILSILARMHEVQRAIVVTTVVPGPVTHAFMLSGSQYLITTCQKVFILAPWIPCRASFHSTTSDPRVHAGVGVLEVNLVHIQKEGFFSFKFSRSPYFDSHLSESIHTCTIDTL